MISYCEFASPLGTLLLVAGDKGLRGLYFDEHRHFAGKAADWRHDSTHLGLARASQQLEEFFAGTRTVFDLPLDLQGTAFQCAAWSALLEIPYGETISYGQHAQRIGKPQAFRAVGAAIGRNPVSIIVPCHRVLGAGGAITGYAGGLERKRALLEFEAGQPAPLRQSGTRQLTRRSANG